MADADVRKDGSGLPLAGRLPEFRGFLDPVRDRLEAVPQRYLVLAVAVVVFLLAAYRNPSLRSSQFVFEEAGAYWAMTFAQSPLAFLFDTWVGYLNVLPRAVFLLARAVPFELAPAFIRIIESLVIAGVAAFFASERFGAVVPSRWTRLAFGLTLGLLPTAAPYGSILHVHWVTAAFLAGLSVLPGRRWFDYPTAAAAVLSGLPAALAAPFFFLRRPDRLALLVAILAAVQVIATLASTRSRNPINVQGIIAQLGPSGLVALALAIALVAVRAVPWRPAVAILGTGLAILVAGSFTSLRFEDPIYERFMVDFWIGIAFVGVVAMSKRPLVALAVVALVIVPGAMRTLRTQANVGMWSDHAQCIGGPIACDVPIDPSRYDVHWPGDPSLYRPPPRGGTPIASPTQVPSPSSP